MHVCVALTRFIPRHLLCRTLPVRAFDRGLFRTRQAGVDSHVPLPRYYTLARTKQPSASTRVQSITNLPNHPDPGPSQAPTNELIEHNLG